MEIFQLVGEAFKSIMYIHKVKLIYSQNAGTRAADVARLPRALEQAAEAPAEGAAGAPTCLAPAPGALGAPLHLAVHPPAVDGREVSKELKEYRDTLYGKIRNIGM